MLHTTQGTFTASPGHRAFGGRAVLAAFAIAAYAATATAIAYAEDEVEWIDLTGTERVPASENAGVFSNDTFDNFWYNEVPSNAIDKFSSKAPVGMTLIFR